MAGESVAALLAELDLTRQVATRARVTAARQLNALFIDPAVARLLARPWDSPQSADVSWDDVVQAVAGLAMAAFTSSLGRATSVGDKQRAVTVLCNAIAAATAAGHAMAGALRPLYADCESSCPDVPLRVTARSLFIAWSWASPPPQTPASAQGAHI
jgi:hypothetical protein